MSRESLIKKITASGCDFETDDRFSRGLEAIYFPGKKLRFWANGEKIVAVFGDTAHYKGKRLAANYTESKIVALLGKPDRVKIQPAMEDVGSARYLYYEDGEKGVVLKVALGDPLPRGLSEWTVTGLYLYEQGSFW